MTPHMSKNTCYHFKHKALVVGKLEFAFLNSLTISYLLLPNLGDMVADGPKSLG
jgi:hypothetical protein